jgi:hypothetical protein
MLAVSVLNDFRNAYYFQNLLSVFYSSVVLLEYLGFARPYFL